MPFRIVRDNIINVKADAIVNTANPRPVVGTGVDTAIYEAAGREQLLAERRKIGKIRRGDAAATPAFALPAKFTPSERTGGAGSSGSAKSSHPATGVLLT